MVQRKVDFDFRNNFDGDSVQQGGLISPLPYRFERCSEPPPLEAKRGPDHLDACHLPLESRPTLRERGAA